MTGKRGRPKKETSKKERIYIRVTSDEKKQIKDIADKKHMTISELILYAISKLR